MLQGFMDESVPQANIVLFGAVFQVDGLFRYLERFVLYKQMHSPRRHGGAEKVKSNDCFRFFCS